MLKKNIALWGISGDLKLLGQSENFVFEVGGYILRITEKSHRTLNELKSELKFISELSKNNVSVANIHRSNQGNDVETIGNLYLSVFEKAKGEVKDPENAFSSIKAARNLGIEIGKTHKIVSSTIKDNIYRHQFYEAPHVKNGLNIIPEHDKEAVIEFKKAINWINNLPKESNTYGLVHMDAHAGNFCVDENDNITLFDFDDCAYNFFAYDLAIPLHHLKYCKLSDQQKLDARNSFLEGYIKEYKLPKQWLDMIDDL